MDVLQTLLNTTVGKLTEKNDALEPGMIAMKKENKATVTTLNTKIEELEGELTVYQNLIGKNVLGATLSHKIDVPKPKKFKGARYETSHSDPSSPQSTKKKKKSLIRAERGVLLLMGAFDLFISEKAVGKLGLSVSKLTKKIKTVNFKRGKMNDNK
ncbi:hypothetical protein J1N35_035055 [Gossypium stocksii]|uniref:Uncharacterized protein n=1 Tax=Gossypium stocksii TaxID=47602 RepID=A0A9D3UTQ0_9ROSI|nr:hypothetical protein J1N35_035055 [Gossypium stocksii]